METDWFTAEFMPCLIALVGDNPDKTPHTASSLQPQATPHAVAILQDANLSIIPVYPGATWPLINTRSRFQA
ncbi:hypothetical protein AAEP93_011528 [Penicillium crustosum]